MAPKVHRSSAPRKNNLHNDDRINPADDIVTMQDIEELNDPRTTRTQWGNWRLRGYELEYQGPRLSMFEKHVAVCRLDQSCATAGTMLGELLRVAFWLTDRPEDLGMLVLALRDIYGTCNPADWDARPLIDARRRLIRIASALQTQVAS